MGFKGGETRAEPPRPLQAEALGFKVGDRVVYSVFETYAQYTVPNPHAVHGTQYTVPNPHTVHGTQYTVPNPHTVHGTQYTVPNPHATPCILHAQGTLHTVHGTQCARYAVRNAKVHATQSARYI